MKIVLVDKFFHPFGGTQSYLINLAKLLENKGHQVITFDGKKIFDTDKVNLRSLNRKKKYNLSFALNAIYSFNSASLFSQLLKKEKPDIIHINNLYHHISPSILYVAKRNDIPIVFHLHDYKLVCPRFRLFNKGKFCQKCQNGRFNNLILNQCTLEKNKSLFETLFLFTESTIHHKILKIYNLVDLFIAPSLFLIKQFKKMGFHKKIVYLPSYFLFLDKHKSFSPKDTSATKKIVYFGRLVPEKGLLTLIEAVRGQKVELEIIGEGIQKKILEKKVKQEKTSNIKFLGFLTGNELRKRILEALFVIFPPEWPEPFGRIILESFALGKPVIGSNIGAIPEIIKTGKNGFLFEPGNYHDLRRKIKLLLNYSQVKFKKISLNARKTVETKFDTESYYQKLMKIYKSVL